MTISDCTQIIGVIIAATSLVAIYIQVKKQHSWNRRHATHELLTQLTTGDLAKLRRDIEKKYAVDILNEEKNYKDVYESIPNNEKQDFSIQVRDLFNLFEGVCLGIKNHTLEEDICEDAMCLILSFFWKWGEPLIREKRSSHPAIWNEFETYASKWYEETNDRSKIPVKKGKKRI